MKGILTTVALMCCIASTHATAAPVTVEYKAVVGPMVETIYDPSGSTQHTVLSSRVTGFEISRGETVTGYFTYDTATPLKYSEDMTGLMFSLDGQFQQSLRFQNSPEPISYSQHYLTTTATQTPYRISTQSSNGDYRSETWVAFERPNADDIPFGYLPPADQWGAFGTGSRLEFKQEAADQSAVVWLRADITSFRVVSAVPEPATGMMLAAGLGLLCIGRRYRDLLGARKLQG